jgi:hypothetical protein
VRKAGDEVSVMTDEGVASRERIGTAVGALLCVYLYFVGFCLGSTGAHFAPESIGNVASSIGNAAFTFAVAPFIGLAAGLGFAFVLAEGPQSWIGSVFAVLLLAAMYALHRRGLRSWRMYLFPLYAYGLGFAVQFVLIAYLGVRTPPLSF